MKLTELTPFLLLAVGLTGLSVAHASNDHSNGGSSGGGGDVACDKLIQDLSFADTNGNLRDWLKNGGPEAQTPKLDLSSSLNPSRQQAYSYADYEKALGDLLTIFSKAPDVNCVQPGDEAYPVDVNNRQKICKTLVDSSGVHITCDRDLFLKLSTDDQIEQVHHEFAINVPGLEPDTGSISTYKISAQLSNSIATVKERRLVVGSGHCPSCETVATNLLNRPIEEALPISHLKLRLKKEIYLDGQIADDDFKSDIGICSITYKPKYLGKIVSCSNADGSPREFSLSKKDVQINETLDLLNPMNNGTYVEINPHLPVIEKSYYTPLLFQINTAAHIKCKGLSGKTTLQELISDLEPYYELVEDSDLSAPAI